MRWCWQFTVSNESLLLAVTAGECRFMLPLPQLITHHKSTLSWLCVLRQTATIRFYRGGRHAGGSCCQEAVWSFEITFPFEWLNPPTPPPLLCRMPSCPAVFKMPLWTFRVTGSTDVSDCSCGPFSLMRCLPPIIIQLGAEHRETEGGRAGRGGDEAERGL